MLLKDQVAVITGAGQGIGKGIAERFAEEGARVMIADLLVEQGTAIARDLNRKECPAIFGELNVTDEESIRRALSRCVKEFGGVDILVNNAGINLAKPVVEMSRAEWEQVLAVNLTGPFLCAQIFARFMVQQQRGGSILFISSQAGKRGEAGAAAYSSSKFGVIGLMQCLALEMAPWGIRVNAVCPGSVDAPMLHWLIVELARREHLSAEEMRQKLVRAIPLGRLATPSEVADAFVFLASPLASYITGETINVDGGELSG
jgi:NAD(P)-dependent dehydrogenase (short-subunit alcohol dehydrogenase family)